MVCPDVSCSYGSAGVVAHDGATLPLTNSPIASQGTAGRRPTCANRAPRTSTPSAGTPSGTPIASPLTMLCCRGSRKATRRCCRPLREAPPNLQCWTFLPAPTPLAFWARRQAHETTIHRVDAELAAVELTSVDQQVVVNGIDEPLTCFVTRRRGRLRSERTKTLSVQATDSGTSWHLTVSMEPALLRRAGRLRRSRVAVVLVDPDLRHDVDLRGRPVR